jgi:hypothetical protein
VKVPEATIELLQVDSVVLVYVFLLNPIFQIQKYSMTQHFTRKQLDVKGLLSSFIRKVAPATWAFSTPSLEVLTMSGAYKQNVNVSKTCHK